MTAALRKGGLPALTARTRGALLFFDEFEYDLCALNGSRDGFGLVLLYLVMALDLLGARVLPARQQRRHSGPVADRREPFRRWEQHVAAY